MTTFTLGKSAIQLTPVGLGCWQFSRGSGAIGQYWSDISSQEIEDIVRTTLEGGINWFDTAEIYGKGASEESLAVALQNLDARREDYVIADKWWPLLRTAKSITRTFPERESALKGIGIDLYQIHQPFSFSSVPNQIAAMAELHKSGRIQAVGVSNFNEKQMRIAHARLADQGLTLASNQVRYSLIDRVRANG